FLLLLYYLFCYCFFFFQAEDGIRDFHVTGVQTCALPISLVRPEPVFVRFTRTFVRSAQVFGRTCVWIVVWPWAGFGAEAACRGPKCRAPQVSQTPRGLRRLGRILYLYKPPHVWYYDSTGCVFLSPSRSP